LFSSNYRPRITDEQVIKLVFLLREHVRLNSDDDLERLLDLLEERSKRIAFTQWEAEQEIRQVEAEIEDDIISTPPVPPDSFPRPSKPVERFIAPELLAQVEKDRLASLGQTIPPDIQSSENSEADGNDVD